MIRRAIILAAAAAVAALGAGCNGEGPAGPAPGLEYPDALGSEWAYAYGGGDAVRYVIAGTFRHPAAGETRRLEEYLYNGSEWVKNKDYYVKVSAADVRFYYTPLSNVYFRPLKLDLDAGDEWDAGGGYIARVAGREDVTVRAGTWPCYRVEYVGPMGFTIWWADGVGGLGVLNRGWWRSEGMPVETELSSYSFPP